MIRNDEFISARRLQVEAIVGRMINTNETYGIFLRLRKAQAAHNQLMNESVAFFTIVQRSLLQSLFIEINNMFDPDENSKGVRQLLLKMKTNIALLLDNKPVTMYALERLDDRIWKRKRFDSLAALVEYFLAQIEAKEALIKRVKTQRDKFYAHMDKITGTRELFKNFRVSFEDLHELLLLNTNIAITLYDYFFDKATAPFTVQHNDIDRLIELAEKGLEWDKQKMIYDIPNSYSPL